MSPFTWLNHLTPITSSCCWYWRYNHRQCHCVEACCSISEKYCGQVEVCMQTIKVRMSVSSKWCAVHCVVSDRTIVQFHTTKHMRSFSLRFLRLCCNSSIFYQKQQLCLPNQHILSLVLSASNDWRRQPRCSGCGCTAITPDCIWKRFPVGVCVCLSFVCLCGSINNTCTGALPLITDCSSANTVLNPLELVHHQFSLQ